MFSRTDEQLTIEARSRFPFEVILNLGFLAEVDRRSIQALDKLTEDVCEVEENDALWDCLPQEASHQQDIALG